MDLREYFALPDGKKGRIGPMDQIGSPVLIEIELPSDPDWLSPVNGRDEGVFRPMCRCSIETGGEEQAVAGRFGDGGMTD